MSVDLYFRGSGTWERVAQFRLVDGQIGVVHEPEAADLITAMLTEGYRPTGSDQTEPVTIETPAAFMTALMAPHEASYYRFVDTTEPQAAPGPPVP
ncbi:hypothetical protein LO763_22885 [Glycomyces sp. A-F 0318]|uniref:hypothetical protein n=1 Tax=Glycomyces amatae TaxID=2881355 RepID=UPI001E37ACC0|nr:hypothetical protein [Glycomyces amatae]MCD0446466.1 hypothetical protein [Glycomyces amatae]